MRELRHGVKLKKVQEQEFNPLPTEFQLTPFEMLMQDIRARNYKLRKVMVRAAPARVRSHAAPGSEAMPGVLFSHNVSPTHGPIPVRDTLCRGQGGEMQGFGGPEP